MKSISELVSVLARLCIRNMRANSTLSQGSELYETLFDQIGTFEDLWGIDQE